MKHLTAFSIAAFMAVSFSGAAEAGWGKFWKNVKHGNAAFKKSWNKSSFGQTIKGMGDKKCWEKAATVAFTASIKGSDGKC